MNAEPCHFDSNEAAQGSLLAKRLFQSECVRAILISHDQVTITRTTTDHTSGRNPYFTPEKK